MKGIRFLYLAVMLFLVSHRTASAGCESTPNPDACRSIVPIINLLLSDDEPPMEPLCDPAHQSSSGTGPTTDIWYGSCQEFGKFGVPQRFVNVLGNIDVNAGIMVSEYRLNGGSPIDFFPRLNGLSKNARLENRGDFNIEIDFDDLEPGSNEVEIVVKDSSNIEKKTSIAVGYKTGVTTPTTYSINWNTVTDVSNVAQIVDGKWSLSATGVRTDEIGFDRIIAIGDLSWTNFKAEVEVTVHSNPDPGKFPLVALAQRWTGHFDDPAQIDPPPRLKWWPLGALVGYTWANSIQGAPFEGLRLFGSDHGPKVHEPSIDWFNNPPHPPNPPTPPTVPQLVIGDKYVFKICADSVAGGLIDYKFKFWRPSIDPDPRWQISWTTEVADPPPSGGSLMLTAHHTDATFGNILVTPNSIPNGCSIP